METIQELISVSFSSVSADEFAMLYHFSVESLLTLGRARRHTPTVVQGGEALMELPWVFDMLHYFETILPLVESLWSFLQHEGYFLGGGAAGGLWRHQTWSPSWPPSWILSRTRNQLKTVWINNLSRLTCKITIASFYPHVLLLKKVEKHAFSLKNGLTPATYDVITIVTDRH